MEGIYKLDRRIMRSIEVELGRGWMLVRNGVLGTGELFILVGELELGAKYLRLLEQAHEQASL